METHKLPNLIAGVLILSLSVASAPADFDLDAYLEHLERTRDLDAEGLLRAHEPFGPYQPLAPARNEAPLFFKELNEWLQLTEGELALLQRHDFVVSERWRQRSYGDAYRKIYRKDLPVFVSTDAILHAVHKSYDDLLILSEDWYFRHAVRRALGDMHGSWSHLMQRYRSDPLMVTSLNDVDVFLTVARKLLNPQASIRSEGGNDAMVARILDLVHRERPDTISLFNNVPRHYDFSQMKPRGHYTVEEYPELEHYFRAMMWIGRTEFRLSPPPPDPFFGETDVTREIIDAFLLLELADESGATSRWDEMDEALRVLIGPSDNVTLRELQKLREAVGLEDPSSLLDQETMDVFEDELATGEYTGQSIISQILWVWITQPEMLRPPHAFLLQGQRFLVDSFTTGQVVWPAVPCPDPECLRMRKLPNPLDVLYAVGNDDALPLLESEIEFYEYAPNLSALRYLIDGYEEDFWTGSLYNTWLHAIRTLSMSGREGNAPDFMKTGAWQQEKMNTQLAAWAELRHDNLLYGKQSYTGGGATCSFPHTYIEPIPEFYRTLAGFARDAGRAFSAIPSMPPRVVAYFEYMESIMTRLRGIAEKELSGEPFTDEERELLASVLYRPAAGQGCQKASTGWFQKLYFAYFWRDEDRGAEPDALIADVHTDPNTTSILHVATGLPDLGVFIAGEADCGEIAYVGPVAAFHEHVTLGYRRLTDEEWNRIYATHPPARPDWTYAYLADRDGNLRDGGRVLEVEPDVGAPWEWSFPVNPSDSTGTPADPDTEPGDGPTRFFVITPNPVREDAIVSLRLEGDGAIPVALAIHDSRGRLVRELHRGALPPQLVHFQWDGTTDDGRQVGAGVYYIRLVVDREVTTEKITVVR